MKKPGATRTPPLLAHSQPAMKNNKRSHSAHGPTTSTKKIKKAVGFMDLPGELRNKVYRYYFQQDFICELVDKEAKLGPPGRESFKFSKNDRMKEPDQSSPQHLESVTTVRFSRMLGRYNRIQGLDTKWKTSLTGLVFVSKKIHAETIPFLYSKTLFCFNAPNRLLNFLKVVSAANILNVKRIQLNYRTYGDPKKTNDIPWKGKHLKRWDDTCRIAATKLINLKQIDIFVHLSETDVCLELHQPSLGPLLWFRRRPNTTKSLSRNLETVNVEFHTLWTTCAFSTPEINQVSESIHRLFGLAVSRFILGQSKEHALEPLKKAWEAEYHQLRHHLRYMPPGW